MFIAELSNTLQGEGPDVMPLRLKLLRRQSFDLLQTMVDSLTSALGQKRREVLV
jgi:hypothetical protein